MARYLDPLTPTPSAAALAEMERRKQAVAAPPRKPFDPMNAPAVFARPRASNADMIAANAPLSTFTRASETVAPMRRIAGGGGSFGGGGGFGGAPAAAVPIPDPASAPAAAPAAVAPKMSAQERADRAYANAMFPKPKPGTASPSVAYRIGQALPAVGAGLKDVAATLADVSTYPVRRLGSDVAAIVTGAQGGMPAEGEPFRRFSAPSQPAPAAAAATAPVVAGTPPAAAPAVPATATAAPVPAAVATGTAPPLNGVNTFNGKPIAPELLRPSAPAAGATSAPAPAQVPIASFTRQPAAVAQGAVRAPRRGIEFTDMFGGGLRGGDNATAAWNFASEMKYGKMTPTARRALASLAGQGVEFQNSQESAGLDATNASGAAAAGAANEAALADANNAAAAQINAARIGSEERQAQMGTVTGEDGTVFTRNGAAAMPVTTADGKPVRAAPTAAQGQITAQDRLKALTDQIKAESSSMQPNAERITALQGQIDALTTGGQPTVTAAPTIEQFLTAARASNPNATDEQLTAYYNSKYGR